MANHMLGQINDSMAFVDKRHNPAASASKAATDTATPANYASVTTLRARLTAISGTTYTAARLDAMSVNDMIYALRLSDDLAGV